MPGYLAQIIMFAGNFAPRNWAYCMGQIMGIAQNSALFSLLGTTYGGNGQTTFGLPDLRGRVPVGTGQANGLPNVDLGELAGVPDVTLLSTQMPQHNHLIGVDANPQRSNRVSGHILADGGSYSSAGANTYLSAQALSTAGNSQPHTNMQPYLGVNFIICIQGDYPSRN